MGCSACKEKRCDGGCKNLPPVLQINSEECPVLFHTVEVEGSSDDNPPEIGQYKNVLLVYKGNGAKYIFSSDGIPSAITGDVEFDSLVGRPRYDGVQMTSATNIPNVQETAQAAVDELANSLADVATSGDYDDLINKPVVDTTLDKTSNNAVANSAVTTAIEEITSEIDRPVVYDLEMTSDANSVTFTEDKIDVVTGETTQEIDTIPTASATTAGTINAAEYLTIKDSQDRLDALENGSVAISGLSATPTQAQLTTAWLTATGRDSLINRASIYDIDNTKVWTYYSNITTWEEVTAGTISVNPFTNSVPGTILGSSTDGNVSANLDGTGTVSGWSTLVTTVSGKADSSSLASVATSGNYSDLNGKPTIDSTISTSSTNAVENQAIGNEFEKVAYVGSTSTTPSSVEFVGTDNIEDGAVTADKIDFTTLEISTTESICGSYNGEPIYSKVIIVPSNNNASISVTTDVAIDTLLSVNANMHISSSSEDTWVGVFYGSSTDFFRCFLRKYPADSSHALEIRVGSSNASLSPSYMIELKYTKN